jgi:hypothetical protein
MSDSLLPLGTINMRLDVGGVACTIPVVAALGLATDNQMLHAVLEATADLGDVQAKFDSIAKSLEPPSEVSRKPNEEYAICVHHLIQSASLEAGGGSPVIKCAAACDVWGLAHNRVGGIHTEVRQVCHDIEFLGRRKRVCVNVPTDVPHLTDGPDFKTQLGSDVLDATASVSLRVEAGGKDVAVTVNVSEVRARGAVTEAIRKAVDVVAAWFGKNLLDSVNAKLADSCKPYALASLLPEQFREYPVVVSDANFVTLDGNKVGTHVVAKLDIPADKLAALLQAGVPQ